MASRRSKRAADPLAAMPVELRLENSPERCVCTYCEPALTDAERAEAEAMMSAWNDARFAWAKSAGVGALELLLLERPTLAPPRKRRA